MCRLTARWSATAVASRFLAAAAAAALVGSATDGVSTELATAAQLADFVRASTASNQYNEVVIPKDSWEELLPGAIRAVICIRERASCAQARSVRERFLAAYQLDAASVPFVFYDQHDGFSLIV